MRPLCRSVVALTTLLLSAASLTTITAPPAQAAPAPAMAPAATPSGLARAGDVKVTLVTVQTADRTAAQAKAINMTAAKASISTASNYWKTMSNNRLSISVSKTITGFKTKAKSSQNFDVILETVTKELKWVANPNSALVVFMPRTDVVVYGYGGNYGAGWASGATSGRVLMPYTNSLTNPVMAHEFGHVFGIMHANSLQCTNGAQDSLIVNGRFSNAACSSREYGDSTDLMGVSQTSLPYLNSVLFDYSSMGRGNEILNAGVMKGAKKYTLRAWAGTAANRAVKFVDPLSKETYYLQLRLPVGYDASNAYGGNRGVEILKAAPERGASLLIPPSTRPFSGWYNANHAWHAGKSFTTAGGTRVTVNSITADAATVTVEDRMSQLIPVFKAAATKNPSLGVATGNITLGLKNGGSYQQFKNGILLYSPATGARVSKGGIRTTYLQLAGQNGKLGYPTTDEIGGLKNGGIYQNYQSGAIYWTSATGARALTGAIRTAWNAQGAQNGVLGYPTSGEITGLKNGGVAQSFQGGTIIYTAPTGARIVKGVIRSAWVAQGQQNGKLGYPTSNEYATPNGGIAQNFQGGKIVWTAATGARLLTGAVSTKYFAVGGFSSALGYPTANEVTGLVKGGASQAFKNGYIVWTAATGARISSGDIRTVWLAKGAQNGVLGYPTSDEVKGLKDGGSYQSHQGGFIYKSAAGTFISKGGIRTKWVSLGAEKGVLGYPTSNEYSSGNGSFSQDYQGGKIFWTAKGGSVVTLTPVVPVPVEASK